MQANSPFGRVWNQTPRGVSRPKRRPRLTPQELSTPTDVLIFKGRSMNISSPANDELSQAAALLRRTVIREGKPLIQISS